MSKRYINILSSFSKDRLIDEQGTVLALQAGGPALFIKNTLENTGVPFKLNCGTPIEVEILITNKGEFGRISQLPRQQTNDLALADWAIVSTVLDEWQLNEPLPSKLFVDLQGYVRDGSDFGKKQTSTIINRLAGKVFCLKGTKEEVSYLAKNSLERQKKKLLVITNGSQGVELYYRGKYKYFPVSKVENLSNTIGAGDTFFAYFVASMFQDDNPAVAAQYAIEQTNKFLKTKQVKEGLV